MNRVYIFSHSALSQWNKSVLYVNENLRLIKTKYSYKLSFFSWLVVYVFVSFICICTSNCICICIHICTCVINCICIQSWACLFPGQPMMSPIPCLTPLCHTHPHTHHTHPPAVDELSREWWPSWHMGISKLCFCIYQWKEPLMSKSTPQADWKSQRLVLEGFIGVEYFSIDLYLYLFVCVLYLYLLEYCICIDGHYCPWVWNSG